MSPPAFKTLISQLGEGAFGKVVRSYHRKLGYFAAVKVFHDNEKTELEEETTIIELLKGISYVLPILAKCSTPPCTWFAMPLFGSSLSDELRKQGRLRAAAMFAFAAQLCDAVQAIHAASVLHLDLKPGNIIAAMAKVQYTRPCYAHVHRGSCRLRDTFAVRRNI